LPSQIQPITRRRHVNLRLDGHVETTGDSGTLQGLRRSVLLSQVHQTGHLTKHGSRKSALVLTAHTVFLVLTPQRFRFPFGRKRRGRYQRPCR
jgi:hypothetical protein